MKTAHQDSLAQMRSLTERSPGCRWAAYENAALDSSLCGHLQFLAVGPLQTYKEAPANYPADTKSGMGWRYLFCGWVDLETGHIEGEKDA